MKRVVLLLWCLSLAVSAAPKRPVASVVAVSGSARRTSPGSAPAQLAVQDVLREGDRLSVSAGSSVVVRPTGKNDSYSLKGPQELVMAAPGRAIDRRWFLVTRRARKSDLIEGEPMINTGIKEAQELPKP